MPAADPDRQSVLAALDRILAWPEIARSPQLGRFLDYIVQRTLDGDGQAIKAYSIAVDVLGRPADFDPQVDPIVRVQARRLRSLLEQYYETAGSADPVRITLPVGRYVPMFASIESPVAQEPVEDVAADTGMPAARAVPLARPRGHITLSWFTLLIATLGIAALAYALSTWEPRQAQSSVAAPRGPSLTVVEFQDLSGVGNRPVVAGLALELVSDLNVFEDIDARYGGGEAVTVSAKGPPSDFVLTGIVRRADKDVQYSAILTETASGTVVWNRTISISEQRSLEPDALDEMSKTLSLVLGNPRGPIHLPARRTLSRGIPQGVTPTPYMCRVLFDLYREAGTVARGTSAATCYDDLPESERQDPVALAAQASLISEGMVGVDAPALEPADRMRIAEATLDRATAAAPLSAFVWEQEARWFEMQGRYRDAGTAYASSIQLNPANSDALIGVARLMSFRGHLHEAEPLVREAVDGTPMPPPWYFAVPALLALRDKDYTKAIANAQTYAIADPELGPVLAVVAASLGGNAGVVNRYLPQVLGLPAFRTVGILPRLSERISDAGLLDEISTTLTQAGVPASALTAAF